MSNNTNTTIIPTSDPKPEVELSGRDGNAMSILGACRKSARKAGWTTKQQDALQKEMLGGDYDHVLGTAGTYFEIL